MAGATTSRGLIPAAGAPRGVVVVVVGISSWDVA
jgi:hypothetical protein